MLKLLDSFGRVFPYVRLSLTDACNFRCSYCLPNGYKRDCAPNYLSLSEIGNLAQALKALGVTKIRLTGGEPSLRHDLPQVIAQLKTIGIEKVALTTNGYKLPQIADDLIAAGLDAINISIDSLKRENFAKITGHDKLNTIWHGIERLENKGFNNIKINAVLLKGLNDFEFADFLKFAQNHEYDMRFIELMRTNDNRDFFNKHHLSADILRDKLKLLGFKPQIKAPNDGPSENYSHPQYLGKIGLIAPYSKDFCKSCNRLRISAKGGLGLCLFGDDFYDLRPLLQSAAQKDELEKYMMQCLKFKIAGHRLESENSGRTKHLASIGG